MMMDRRRDMRLGVQTEPVIHRRRQEMAWSFLKGERDLLINKETPTGFPLANPETLKLQEMVKIVRKKGGVECDGVTKFSIIRTVNGKLHDHR
jgi:hypothetical protein